METHDDLTSLDVNSESPEILSVSSFSSTLSTSTIASQDSPETLKSLLLKIEQFHTTETQNLHEKVNKWKTKCAKLADIANNNANAAKRYYKHNKLLVIKIEKLEHQMKALQSPSRFVGMRCTIVKQEHSPIKEPPGKAGIQNKGPPNKVLQNEAQSKVSSKPPSKLTSKKSRKKVRYSEVPPDAMLEKQPSELTTRVDPEMAKIRPFDHQKCSTPQVARILAPDTCPSPTIPSPSCKMNPSSGATPSGHDKTNPSDTGPEPWITENGHAFTIPETLGVGVSDVTTIIDLTDEDLCAPAYESTPVWEKPNISSDLESSKSLHDLSMKKLFPETPVGRKLLVTTMPRSESQFPVDLYNTQVKSPTFCGESVMTTPRIADTSVRHGSKVTVRKNEPTPRSGDNSDMCAWEETCESEDSILLLGHREQVYVAKASDAEVASRSKSNQENQREENTTSRDSKETTRSAEFQNQTTPAKDLSTPNFKKRRYSPGDSLNPCEETILPDAAELGKGNSPEGLDDLSSHSSPNLISGVKQIEEEVNRPEENAVRRGRGLRRKSLKQSKLSESMFKPGVNRPVSLMQKYNGGSAACAHVDSELDTYLNQAIERSLVEQKGSVHGGKEMTDKSGFKRRKVDTAVLQSEDASVGFKIPSIPHQKKQTRLGSPTPNTEKREHLPDSLDFTCIPQDLNGSVDPLMDLTRLESDGVSSPGEMDQCRQKEHPRSGRGDNPGQEADFGSHSGDEGNDSCVDLFQEDEDEEDYEDEEAVDEEGVDEEAGDEEAVDEEDGDGEAVDDEGVDEEVVHEEVVDEEAVDNDFVDRSVDRQGVNGYVNTFDKVPEKNEQPNYKYTEVVRKRDERQKLKGFGCKECDQFYGNLQLTDAEREVRIKECSRHRAQFSPPNTPDHYWSIGFPDTQTCIQRGYINQGGSPERRVRKRNKYNLKAIFGKEVAENGNEMCG